jgi:hypothetical protein
MGYSQSKNDSTSVHGGNLTQSCTSSHGRRPRCTAASRGTRPAATPSLSSSADGLAKLKGSGRDVIADIEAISP